MRRLRVVSTMATLAIIALALSLTTASPPAADAAAPSPSTNASLQYVLVEATGGTGYRFKQYSSFASIPGTTPVEQSATSSRQIRAIASDGNRWFAILRSSTQNCFATFTSYANLVESRPHVLRCVDSPIDGYRGVAWDGRFFSTVYHDNGITYWQTYLTWGDVVTNTPYSTQASTRNTDGYRSIGYDPTSQVYFSLWGSGTAMWFLQYATFDDMITVTSTSESYSIPGNPPYVGLAVGPVNPVLDVYVVAGQSNAVGYGTDGAQLPASSADAQIRFFYRQGDGDDQYVSTSGTVTTLGVQTANFNRGSPPATSFGLEMGIGRTLYAQGRRDIAIVKVGYGNTDLASQWNPANANGLFTVLRDQLSAATSQWNQQGYRTRIAGFFWMQGDADALNQSMAANYGTNLTNFKAAVRSVAADRDLPFIVGRIRAGSNLPYAGAVRTAQSALRAGDPLTVAVIDTDAIPVASDNLHYNSTGEIALGNQMGSAFTTLSGW
ncbi:sialate O-acetylesterase [Homoserinibacter sp. YIM 151385]|uniref:sialate O-acetylesterase n=1 Tax=Homoserinibacter sp. YIM 151385 TaxID=2985506 RepID=UPI0022EFE41D|nr:sialate O-acetylesterase [Homoserinibacter sp. YIM 151385]WBU37444.1 hypothetical protein OF852_11035 [Homoserinibacter sp. YIM 151385]